MLPLVAGIKLPVNDTLPVAPTYSLTLTTFKLAPIVRLPVINASCVMFKFAPSTLAVVIILVVTLPLARYSATLALA